MTDELARALGAHVALTHILVVADIDRSRAFWVDIMSADLYRKYGGTSVVLRFAGGWLLLVTGGGPTADKPDTIFAPPAEGIPVSHAMTVRVADCPGVYEALRARGASFLTPLHDWGAEVRCFLRDPDGHLVEFSQAANRASQTEPPSSRACPHSQRRKRTGSCDAAPTASR